MTRGWPITLVCLLLFGHGVAQEDATSNFAVELMLEERITSNRTGIAGNESATTFAVAPVEPGRQQLPIGSLNESADKVARAWAKAARKLSGLNMWGFPMSSSIPPDFSPLQFETGAVNHKKLLRTFGMNGFLSTVLTAYNYHRRLIFTPDDWWMLIALQVAKFISQPANAEKYRTTFVNHTGKMDLIVDGLKYGIKPKSPESNSQGWPKVVAEFGEKIGAHTNGDIKDLLMKGFSTSGSVENAAFAVVLMESMKQYFTYKTVLLCGIPEITLEGTAADYLNILERIDRVKELIPEFAWYLNRTREHMERIYDSKIGNAEAHRDWWRVMVTSQMEGSGGGTAFTGWLSDFFAYDAQGHVNNRPSYPGVNGPRTYCRRYEGVMTGDHPVIWAGPKFSSFDAAMVTLTDMQLVDAVYTGKTYRMKFVAGFYGCALDEDDENALRPAIGWGSFYWKEK